MYSVALVCPQQPARPLLPASSRSRAPAPLRSGGTNIPNPNAVFITAEWNMEEKRKFFLLGSGLD